RHSARTRAAAAARRLTGLVAACITVGACMSPPAEAAEFLPVAWTYPADGAEVLPTSGFYLEISGSYAYLKFPRMEIASRNVIGVDGTLSDDYRVDLTSAEENTEHPGTYRAYATLWPTQPGTYYWQAIAAVSDGVGGFTDYVSDTSAPGAASLKCIGTSWTSTGADRATTTG